MFNNLHGKIRDTLNAWADGVTALAQDELQFTRLKSLIDFESLSEIFAREGYTLTRQTDKAGHTISYSAKPTEKDSTSTTCAAFSVMNLNSRSSSAASNKVNCEIIQLTLE
ncbi:MAG: hypothetical protein K0Q57_690 [Gammaproteobacteria bacterium]|jgi:hypothetical protein|nr:hypothetical protein [Gammaproteobacteria bacterium]